MTALRNLSDRNYNEAQSSHDVASTWARFGANILPVERAKLLQAIEYLSKLEDNWNGRTARRPSSLSVTRANQFVDKLWGKKYPDHVSPDGEGGLSFTWKAGASSLIITCDSSLIHLSHMYFGFGEKIDVFWDNVPFDGNIIPLEVNNEIPARSR